MTTESQSFESRCRRLVADLRLGAKDDVRSARPLTGGVASDIGVVDLGGREICVKFALAKLKVAAEWHAPVHRNRAEYRWLAFAGSVVPAAVPHLHGWSESENGFAMEYLHGPDIQLWKMALLQGAVPDGVAAATGRTLGRIHAASTKPGFDPTGFDNADDFHALRLEPYLIFTAGRHPALEPRLLALADRLYRSRQVLVHGDVSPKNILFRSTGPIILDAECATMGDPAFDVAFCINHLILKAIHLPATRDALFEAAAAFWSAYAAEVTWEPVAAVEARLVELLPALMLARIDGKSPVEYLGAEAREQTRLIAVSLIADPADGLAGLVDRVAKGLRA